MSGELEAAGIEGRVFTNGVAQEVTQESGMTKVRLAYLPEVVTPDDRGAVVLPFALPVTLGAGETFTLEVERAGGEQ